MSRAGLWVCLLLFLAPALHAQEVLFGVTTDAGNGMLVRIDPATGLCSRVGNVGTAVFAKINCLASDPTTGTLFAGHGRLGNLAGTELFRINPDSAAAALVGEDTTPPGHPSSLRDLARRPTDGVLFATNLGALATVNPADGQLTGIGGTAARAIEFDPTGVTLFGVNAAPGIGVVDPGTGALGPTVGLTFVGFPPTFPLQGFPRVLTITTRSDGTIFAIVADRWGGGAPTFLATINPATGITTNLGETRLDGADRPAALGLHGIAFHTFAASGQDDGGGGGDCFVEASRRGEPALLLVVTLFLAALLRRTRP